MKKLLNLKNILMIAIVAITAIAGFCVLPTVTSDYTSIDSVDAYSSISTISVSACSDSVLKDIGEKLSNAGVKYLNSSNQEIAIKSISDVYSNGSLYSGPYLIYDYNDLVAVQYAINTPIKQALDSPFAKVKYRLMNNISISGVWEPIGGWSYSYEHMSEGYASVDIVKQWYVPFSGQFDGNGYTITADFSYSDAADLNYTSEGFSNEVGYQYQDPIRSCGLFGTIQQTGTTSVVKNLHLKVTGMNIAVYMGKIKSWRIGAIAGELYGNGVSNNTVENCFVEYTVNISLGDFNSDYVSWGGMVGYANNVRIQNCLVKAAYGIDVTSTVPTSSENVYVGGIVGELYNSVVVSSIFQGANIHMAIHKGSTLFGQAGIGGIAGKTNTEIIKTVKPMGGTSFEVYDGSNSMYNCVVSGLASVWINDRDPSSIAVDSKHQHFEIKGFESNGCYENSNNELKTQSWWTGKTWRDSDEVQTPELKASLSGLDTISNIGFGNSPSDFSNKDWGVTSLSALNADYPIQTVFLKIAEVTIKNYFNSSSHQPQENTTTTVYTMKGYKWSDALSNTITLNSNKEGYLFKGLSKDKDSTAELYSSSNTSATWNGSTTVYAVWEAQPYSFNIQVSHPTKGTSTLKTVTGKGNIYISTSSYTGDVNSWLKSNAQDYTISYWTKNGSSFTSGYIYGTGNNIVASVTKLGLTIYFKDTSGTTVKTWTNTLYSSMTTISKDWAGVDCLGWTFNSVNSDALSNYSAGPANLSNTNTYGPYSLQTILGKSDNKTYITQIITSGSYGTVNLYPVVNRETYIAYKFDVLTRTWMNLDTVAKGESYTLPETLSGYSYFRIYQEGGYPYNSLENNSTSPTIKSSVSPLKGGSKVLMNWGDLYIYPVAAPTNYVANINLYVPDISGNYMLVDTYPVTGSDFSGSDTITFDLYSSTSKFPTSTYMPPYCRTLSGVSDIPNYYHWTYGLYSDGRGTVDKSSVFTNYRVKDITYKMSSSGTMAYLFEGQYNYFPEAISNPSSDSTYNVELKNSLDFSLYLITEWKSFDITFVDTDGNKIFDDADRDGVKDTGENYVTKTYTIADTAQGYLTTDKQLIRLAAIQNYFPNYYNTSGSSTFAIVPNGGSANNWKTHSNLTPTLEYPNGIGYWNLSNSGFRGSYGDIKIIVGVTQTLKITINASQGFYSTPSGWTKNSSTQITNTYYGTSANNYFFLFSDFSSSCLNINGGYSYNGLGESSDPNNICDSYGVKGFGEVVLNVRYLGGVYEVEYYHKYPDGSYEYVGSDSTYTVGSSLSLWGASHYDGSFDANKYTRVESYWRFYSPDGATLIDSKNGTVYSHSSYIDDVLDTEYLSSGYTIRFYVNLNYKTYNIKYYNYEGSVGNSSNQVTPSGVATTYTYGSTPSVSGLSGAVLSSTYCPTVSKKATFLGWSGDSANFNLDSTGRITSVRSGLYGDLEIWGIWGYPISFVDARSNEDITSSVVASVTTGLIAGNGTFGTSGTYYYNFYNTIGINSGSWKSKSVSPSDTMSGYTSFIVGNTYVGSKDGLMSGNDVVKFVGGVVLQDEAIIIFDLNGGNIDGDTSSREYIYSSTQDYIVEYEDFEDIKKSGYKFIGWTATATDGTALASTNSITDGNGYRRFSFADGSSATFKLKTLNGNNVLDVLLANSRVGLTLKAEWELLPYIVKYVDQEWNEFGTQEYFTSDNLLFKYYTDNGKISGNGNYDANLNKDGYRFVGWVVQSQDTTNDCAEWSSGWAIDTQYRLDRSSVGVFSGVGFSKALTGMYGSITLMAMYEMEYTITLTGASASEITISSYNAIINAGFNYNEATKTYSKIYTKSDAIDLVNIQKLAYTFNGWKVTDAQTNEANGGWNEGAIYAESGNTSVSGRVGNVTLEAQWTANNYVVTFVERVGDVASGTEIRRATQNYTFGTPTTLDTPFEKTHYILVKWVIESIDTSQDKGSNWGKVGDDVEIGANITDNYGNVTLRAVFEPIKHIITANANLSAEVINWLDCSEWSTKSSQEMTKTINEGEPIDQGSGNYTFDYNAIGNLPTVTTNGFAFVGWFSKNGTDNDWGAEIAKDTLINVLIDTNKKESQEITIYAKWEIVQFKLTMNANGGIISEHIDENDEPLGDWSVIGGGATAEKVLDYKQQLGVLPDDIRGRYGSTKDKEFISKNNYEFLGWFSKDGTENDWGTQITSSTQINPWDENITLLDSGDYYKGIVIYARWKQSEIKYSYGYYDDGKWIEVVAEIVTPYESSIRLAKTYYDSNESLYEDWYGYKDGVYFGYTIASEDWFIASANSNNWASDGTDVKNGDVIVGGMSLDSKWGDIELRAVLEEIEYTITYKDTIVFNGERVYTDISTQTYTVNSTDAILSYTGAINFKSWLIHEIGQPNNWSTVGTPVEEGVSLNHKYGNFTLVASDGSYMIVYIDGEGDNAKYINGLEPAGYAEGDKITMPIYKKPGYSNCIGWEVVETVGQWLAGTRYNPNQVVTASTGDVKFRVVWDPNDPIEYTMTLTGLNGVTEDNGINAIIGEGFARAGTNIFTKEYTVEDTINIPTISKDFYIFVGWKVTSSSISASEGGWDVDTEYLSLNTEEFMKFSNKTGNVTLEAIWILIPYTITLDCDGGDIDSEIYVLSTNIVLGAIYQNQTIIYGQATPEFALPNAMHIYKVGYTFRGWMVSNDTESYNTATYPNSTTLKYILERNTIDGNYYITRVQQGSYGDSVLKAIWVENSYDVVLHKNDGTTAYDITNTYLFEQTITLDFPETFKRDGYVFVGWAIDDNSYVGIKEYSYISQYLTYDYVSQVLDGNSEGDMQWATFILAENSKIKKIYHGYDAYDTSAEKKRLDVYAVWLPIYTVTIQKGSANAGDGTTRTPTIYQDGVATSLNQFNAQNHYFEGYTLFETDEDGIFNTPKDADLTKVDYMLYLPGYYISGWTISVGSTKYILEGNEIPNPPAISNWSANNVAQLIPNLTNLQYLQGNITAVPNWTPLTFDVIFKIEGSEEYKKNIEPTTITTENVVFDSQYLIWTDESPTIKTIKAIDIAGYTITSAKAYKDGAIQNEPTIAIRSIWNYDTIQYNKYSTADIYNKDTGWYVIIEGYYTPDLYRVELDLNLPYNANVEIVGNSFDINTGDGFSVNNAETDLLKKYSIITPESNYNPTTVYTDRQQKVYTYVDGAGKTYFYIYLLQDQLIASNGNNSALAIRLPYFKIDYYEMQYYYLLNNINENRMYQMVDDLKVDKIEANLGENVSPTDWKFSYCDTNENYKDNPFKFTVVWYRNIINLEVNNLFEGNNSPNGYVIITEIEQIIPELSGHYKYNSVIYAYDTFNARYTYMTFSFNDYKYKDILTVLNYSLSELASNNIKASLSNIVPIYAGNMFTISVYDQSLDSSLDEFIGYRFDNIGEETINSTTWTNIDELPSSSMITRVDLKTYEQNNENLDNYITDKDTIKINANFVKIKYSLNYFVGDGRDDEVKEFYGNIYLNYNGGKAEESNYTIEVKVDNINEILSTMYVNLGYELSKWQLIQGLTTTQLGVAGQETYAITTDARLALIINANFLRTTIYSNNVYPNNAEQDLGKIKAECDYINFKINVKVKDVSQAGNELLREYILNSSTDNAIFNIVYDRQNIYELKINSDYIIKMLSKRDGDKYVYYYQDGVGYAISRLYIEHNNTSSTNQLVTPFDFPAMQFDDINLIVDYDLLSRTINYARNIAVTEDNRILNFYIEVSPLINLEFTASQNEYDINKQARQIELDGTRIANGTDGEDLQIVVENGMYLGYINQQLQFKFTANRGYYEKAILIINKGTAQEERIELPVNSNINFVIRNNYVVDGRCQINIELEPRTYSFDAKIEYNLRQYEVYDYKSIVNTSGTNIFDLTNGVAITSVPSRTDVFYNGDVIQVKYTLNPAIANEYNVELRANGVIMAYNSNTQTYHTTFNGEDLLIIIKVEPKSSKVILQTNFKNEIVAEIYAQVNDSTPQIVMSKQNVDLNNSFELSSGDVLNVYVKTYSGFSFDEQYTGPRYPIDPTKYNANITETEDGYLKFSVFDINDVTGAGEYNSNKNGYYTLLFTQIPIEIVFDYRLDGEPLIITNSDQEVTYSSNDLIIKLNSEITLNKGNDAEGRRFIGYTYAVPLGQDGCIELNETFVITDEIIEYLALSEIVDGKIYFTIYVNYISQYTFDIELVGEIDKILYTITDEGNNQLSEDVYYDRGTQLNMSLSSIDTVHYVISLKMQDVTYIDGEAVYGQNYTLDINGWTNNALYSLDNIVYTNQNCYSAFNLTRYLAYNFKITIILEPEIYYTNIIEQVFYTPNQLESEPETPESVGNLLMNKNTFESNLTGIHYRVESDFKYNSQVKVTIIIENVVDLTDDGIIQEGYGIYKLILNDEVIEFPEGVDVVYDGKDSVAYTFAYDLIGDSLADMQLKVQYKKLYKVEVKLDLEISGQ